MALSSHTLGFIGAGNMAEAIIRGLLRAVAIAPERIHIADVRADRVRELSSELGVTAAEDNLALMSACSVVVLAVKPQGIGDLLAELAGAARPDQVFISILAGTRADRLEAGLRHDACPNPRVIRAMPNTPALVSAGATGVAPGSQAQEEDVPLALEIFSAVGIAEVFAADQMDAITGLTGSGPAYVFRMIEALTSAAEKQGLEPDAAARMVKQMVWGAALMAKDSGDEPAELRRRVTSPGGTTAAGLARMDERGFVETVEEAVDAATKRGAELSGG